MLLSDTASSQQQLLLLLTTMHFVGCQVRVSHSYISYVDGYGIRNIRDSHMHKLHKFHIS